MKLTDDQLEIAAQSAEQFHLHSKNCCGEWVTNDLFC